MGTRRITMKIKNMIDSELAPFGIIVLCIGLSIVFHFLRK